jgi:protein-S-isoprenylcysteine O-methyltransferase Ste14
MPPFPKRYADAVAKLRVPSGFVLVAVFAWFSRPTSHSLALGLPFGLLGLALRAWAAGCLAKNQQLATGVASRNIGLGILFIAVFLLVYLPVIQLEEQHLRNLFPEYAPYAGQVPALWPRLTPAPTKNSNRFQTALYLRNQEYQAGAGFAAGMLFLLWKVLG